MSVTSKRSNTSKKSDEEEETPYADRGVYRGHSLFAFIIGIPIPAVCIWLWTRLSTGRGCETFINLPLLIIGILIIIFLVCGVALGSENPTESCACFSRETILFLLLSALLGYAIFIFTVTTAGGGRVVPGGNFQEYVLSDYSHWLRNRVNNTHHWDHHLKTCLVKKNVCHKFFHVYANDSSAFFLSRNLSSIESGCCKPPTECNFEYTSPTHWVKPNKEANQSSNVDCAAWDNAPDVLCFNCQSCKAGFANDVKSRWLIVGVVIIVVICFVAFVSPCSSCKGGLYSAALTYFCVTQVATSIFDSVLDNFSMSKLARFMDEDEDEDEDKGEEDETEDKGEEGETEEV